MLLLLPKAKGSLCLLSRIVFLVTVSAPAFHQNVKEFLFSQENGEERGKEIHLAFVLRDQHGAELYQTTLIEMLFFSFCPFPSLLPGGLIHPSPSDSESLGVVPGLGVVLFCFLQVSQGILMGSQG